MTRRIELLFFLYDSKNCEPLFFLTWLKELNTLFSLMWLKRIWTLFWIWFTEQFFIWFKELNIFRKCNSKNLISFWKLLNFALKIYSKSRSFIFLKMSQRIGPFFWNVTQRILPSNMTRMELFSSKYNTQSWTFFEHDSRNCFFFKKKNSQKRLKELNTFLIWLNFFYFFKKTQRFFFKKKLKELNSLKNKTWLKELRFFWVWLRYFFQKIDSQNWTFFWMWLKKIEPFFPTLLEELNPFHYDSKNWTLFPNKTPRIEPFNNTTQRFCSSIMTQKCIFFEYDSTNWTFFVWLQALNFCFQNDSNN